MLVLPVCGSGISVHRRDNVIRLGSADSVEVTRGEINQTVFKPFITTDSSQARLVKGVEVGRYYMHSELSQGRREWFDEERFLQQKARRPVVSRRRISLQRITGIDESWRVIGHIVEPPAYFADSTSSIVVVEDSPMKLEYVLGVLNSKLTQWSFRTFSSNNNVGTNELDILPFRQIDFDDPTDAAMHDELVSLVVRIMELRERIPLDKNPDGRRRLQTSIEVTEQRINRTVYDLFELTRDEVRLVEDGMVRSKS